MLPTILLLALAALVLLELIKGLSANGTPPVLQKFSWQLDLAYFMWRSIWPIRVVLLTTAVVVFILMTADERLSVLAGAIVLLVVWAIIFWVFNFFWVGKYKFLPLTHPNFVGASDNQISLDTQVVGIDHEGQQKAYPVNMLFYHHQIPDQIGNLPIWVTYCGLCRSARVYNASIDGNALRFGLVGAIAYNAVFKDLQTGSWWRQETGEAVKGQYQGRSLEDVPAEQMSLEHWLAKHPGSTVLQQDPQFQNKYRFIASLMNYEASLPGWHMQETPPLIIGVQRNDQARAYDWEELKQRRLVQDTLGATPLLIISSSDGASAFTYDRTVNGEALEFSIDGDTLTDAQTGPTWNLLGQCTDGSMKGAGLITVQHYQQFVRAWATFHPETSYYKFEYSPK
jgi:hypothetical protein